MPLEALSPDNDYKSLPAPFKFLLRRAEWDMVMGGERGIGPRLRALEDISTGIERIQVELTNFGQQRLDEAIVPLIEQTQTDIAALQLTLTNLQGSAGALLADIQQQADALILSVQQDVAALQQQIDEILGGGIGADNVNESATRVFLTPEEKAEISQLRQDLGELAADVGNLAFSSIRPAVLATANVAAEAGQRILCMSGTPITVLFPESPTNGDTIDVGRHGIENVTVDPNGQTISPLTPSETLVIDQDKVVIRFTYYAFEGGGIWIAEPRSIL